MPDEPDDHARTPTADAAAPDADASVTAAATRDSSLDAQLEPMRRDSRFLVRLGLALLVGAMAAAFVGWKIQSAASGCGSGLIRPGTTVIPPPGSGTP